MADKPNALIVIGLTLLIVVAFNLLLVIHARKRSHFQKYNIQEMLDIVKDPWKQENRDLEELSTLVEKVTQLPQPSDSSETKNKE